MSTVVLKRYIIGLLLPALLFTYLAIGVDNAVEIQLLNAIRLSMSTGVLVAYMPPVLKILHDPQPLQRSDYLSFGIVWSWLGAACSGVWWVAYQLMGRPSGMSNNDFVALTIFLSCIGALFHLAAPGALDRRVPPLRWVVIGGLVATGLFGALLIFDAEDLRMRFQGFVALHDWRPGVSKSARPGMR